MSFIVSEQVSNSLVLKQDVYIKSTFTALTCNIVTYPAKPRVRNQLERGIDLEHTNTPHKIARHTKLS